LVLIDTDTVLIAEVALIVGSYSFCEAFAMINREMLHHKKDDILRLAAIYGARNVRIFGPVVRGEAGLDSDIDFLVDMEPGRTLFDLGGLLFELQELLGVEVDVVPESGLRENLRSRILKEAAPL
jgi:uncharacterized protein